ncbi:cysteine protease [Desulfosporosinus orientis DSM 765]|uniref:Cysteine protease n=1 Tax=Desulfosporosinus orientis (strain ATCC 19365 / DSM 765 / NCIMB 8382 / VKM B-1628 / Singapore I) TaxID=768706 RepID=G7WF68_DESOD|nr:C1 family peptidase [Desulfosporosinus orientis]AET67679.1 cysteine protease [Desulfosporosinus orientis DSM 765]
MRKYLCKKDQHDERDYLYARLPIRKDLPSEIDLRSGCSPVVDQGELGSCTANAIGSGLREYLEIKNMQTNVPLSRLFLYYHERLLEGTVDEDSGAEIRDGIKVLKKLGICSEALWPYEVSQFTVAPSAEAETEAGRFKIDSYQRLRTIYDVQRCLAEGYPVVMGMSVYESFESDRVAQSGIVPSPRAGEEVLGGHAMLIVGYKKMGLRQCFIVRNSWGESWGDKGYCYIPAKFINNGIIFDLWTAR